MNRESERFLPNDRTFRRLVVGATALALAATLGSAAAFQRLGPDRVGFAWHWTVLVWSGAGATCAWPFWRLVWAVQENPTRRAKLRLIFFCVFLLALGLGEFLYPIRFTSAAHRSDVFAGLILAACFLAVGAGLLIALARAFARADSEESNPR